MQFRTKYFSIFVGLCMVISSAAQNPHEKIDSLLTAYCEEGCFNGVVLVSSHGKIILRKAYGIADRELNVPMTTDMKFHIASLSKPFTSMIILQLVNEGKIRLDGKITDYVPDYTGEKGDNITIAQLLTHTSGILENLDPAREAKEERLYHSLADMVKFAEENDLYFEPGTGFHYSNLAYNLLAYISECVANKPFNLLLAERIFDPLEMRNTKQYDAAIVESNLAKGYEYKLLNGYEKASFYDPSYTVGPGGLVSTVDDLLKFDQALNVRKFISADLYSKMFLPSPHGSYGYGWELSKRTTSRADTLQIFSHAGSINGFGSYMARIESDSILVIVLKNSRTDSYISPSYAPVIGQEIISILLGDKIDIPKKSIARHMGYIIGHKGINDVADEYYRIKNTDYEHYNFEESELNKLGIELFFRLKMQEEALKIFSINMTEFPYSYNVYDSYAYILMQKGDYINSIKYYKTGLRVLKKYPRNNSSESVLKDAENALMSIKEMEGKIKKRDE